MEIKKTNNRAKRFNHDKPLEHEDMLKSLRVIDEKNDFKDNKLMKILRINNYILEDAIINLKDLLKKRNEKQISKKISKEKVKEKKFSLNEFKKNDLNDSKDLDIYNNDINEYMSKEITSNNIKTKKCKQEDIINDKISEKDILIKKQKNTITILKDKIKILKLKLLLKNAKLKTKHTKLKEKSIIKNNNKEKRINEITKKEQSTEKLKRINLVKNLIYTEKKAKNLYLDGNNLLFVNKEIRNELLMKKNKKNAEAKLADISLEYCKSLGIVNCYLIFDKTEFAYSKLSEGVQLEITSAYPKFKSSDDAFVELAGRMNAEMLDNSVFVTSDKELISKLMELGARYIFKSGEYMSETVEIIKKDIYDDILSKKY